MDTHQITAKLLHGMHMLFDLLIAGHTWLVQNAIDVYFLIIKVYTAAAGFNFTQAKVRFDLRCITIFVDELRNQSVQVWVFRRPYLRVRNFKHQALLFLACFKG